ncbi:serine/threonine protein kinase, partial [Streptomyces sp. 15-116A]|nr:serine/threonine protein kinase [Streptomyces sp. 15-116A]
HPQPRTGPEPPPRTTSPTPPLPVAGTTAVTPQQPERNRRALIVLIAGVTVLALALAGLTYGLLNRGDGDGGGGSGARTGVSTPAQTGDEEEGGPTQETTRPPTSPTPSETEETSPPAQTVRVTVHGERTDYSGACPPPSAEAPSFTATFTVGRLPAEVSYRWVAEDGSVDDTGWKTLSFPKGGGLSKQDTVVVTTYSETGTLQSALGVEVREPVRTTSDSVPFSVACETETPPGGVSPSPSGSVVAP